MKEIDKGLLQEGYELLERNSCPLAIMRSGVSPSMAPRMGVLKKTLADFEDDALGCCARSFSFCCCCRCSWCHQRVTSARNSAMRSVDSISISFCTQQTFHIN